MSWFEFWNIGTTIISKNVLNIDLGHFDEIANWYLDQTEMGQRQIIGIWFFTSIDKQILVDFKEFKYLISI